MNKGLLAIIAAAALGLSKSTKGSPARAVFESEKSKKRFKELNGYEMDSLIDVMLDAYVQQFMNLEPFYDYLEQNNIDYKDRPYFIAPMFTTNLGISANLLDGIGIKYKEGKRHPAQPDWYHVYGIIVKNFMGKDILINALIQEERENLRSINPIVDGKKNKNIQVFFDGIETLRMDTWEDFTNTSLNYRLFSEDLTTSFYIRDHTPNRYDFSSGFVFLKKDLYLKIKGFLESNKMAMDIFKNVAREMFKHELIHVLELHSSWRTASHGKHGMKNYMSSRTERRTWGQSILDEVNFMLQTYKEAEKLFPEETTDLFNSPYRGLKFSYEQGILRHWINLPSVSQFIGNKDLISKTLEWINLPQNEEKFSDMDVQNDFILKTFPILKEKPFQHWMQMVRRSIKDNSSGSVSLIGGKGSNLEGYKKCLKRFFDICSEKEKFKPTIYVFTGASEQKDAGEYEVKLLKEMGADVKVFKSFAYLPIEIPSNLNGIFFTGGDQSRLMKELGLSGKSFIQKANRRGVHIAGTSAGSAVLSEKIIVGGDDEPVITDGIGFITKYIVDQHFSSRNRKKRLQKAMELTGLMGIGVDEDTMITVFDDGYSDITGAGNVILLFKGKGGEATFKDGEATIPGLIF